MSRTQMATVQTVPPAAEILARMPFRFLKIKLGDPLTEVKYRKLTAIQMVALTALRDLVAEIPGCGVGITLEAWKEIKAAYDSVVALGLGSLCPIRCVAFEFGVDQEEIMISWITGEGEVEEFSTCCSCILQT